MAASRPIKINNQDRPGAAGSLWARFGPRGRRAWGSLEAWWLAVGPKAKYGRERGVVGCFGIAVGPKAQMLHAWSWAISCFGPRAQAD
jgi:hypothetical protein